MTNKKQTDTKIITFVSLKGGVGKTTSAMEWAECLRHKGYKTLLIDLDGQCSLSFVCGAIKAGESVPVGQSVSVIFSDDKATFRDVIRSTQFYGDIVCGHETTYSVNAELSLHDASRYMMKACDDLRNNSDYDFVIVDTPPALSVLTLATLYACDYVIIPVYSDVLSLQSIQSTYTAIQKIQQFNPKLKCGGVLFCSITSRLLITRNMIETIERHAQTRKLPIFKTKIRRCCTVQECQAMQMTLHEYDANCTTICDYRNAVKEFLEREGFNHGKKEI